MPIKPDNVDQYLDSGCGRCELGGTPDCKVIPWQRELQLLREILLESDLTEEIKWSAPCHTHRRKNILMLSALKESVVVSFFRGAELKDPENILVKPGENSRFAKYIRFTDVKAIESSRQTILDYIREAIELELSGKKPQSNNNDLMDLPDELLQEFEKNPELKAAFSALTPGRQRGYLIHFTSARQSKTRTSRIEKCTPKILAGKGWNER